MLTECLDWIKTFLFEENVTSTFSSGVSVTDWTSVCSRVCGSTAWVKVHFLGSLISSHFKTLGVITLFLGFAWSRVLRPLGVYYFAHGAKEVMALL
jgi:hypothetical protein